LNNFLGINAILIVLLVFIGYLILGRGFSGTIIGTMKAIIGVLLLQIGSGALVGLAKPIFAAFQKFSGTSVIYSSYKYAIESIDEENVTDNCIKAA
ncbi:PTS transporter subunit IIC, partial [Mycoplasmopsis bovis]|uniref:PTS transporter subunit IIC n=1 Tax=Mycoplasmopsis bovis TaxID=28903 RepID=UPI003D27B6CE